MWLFDLQVSSTLHEQIKNTNVTITNLTNLKMMIKVLFETY